MAFLALAFTFCVRLTKFFFSMPRLPASEGLRKKAIATLAKRGIDGVLTFPTMLAELVSRVDVNKNYEKSDLLQAIRLLKNYDFLKDPQLELFGKKQRKG